MGKRLLVPEPVTARAIREVTEDTVLMEVTFDEKKAGDAFSYLPGQFAELALHAALLGEHVEHRPPQRLLTERGRVLRHVAAHQAPLALHRADGGLIEPRHQAQQRRLALAVGTDEPDPVGRTHAEAQPLQDVLSPEALADVVAHNQGHLSSTRGLRPRRLRIFPIADCGFPQSAPGAKTFNGGSIAYGRTPEDRGAVVPWGRETVRPSPID